MHNDRQHSTSPQTTTSDNMTTNRPFLGGFLAAFRAQPTLQKAAGSQSASVVSYSTANNPSQNQNREISQNTHATCPHLKTHVTAPRRQLWPCSSDKPLPANKAARAAVPPLHISHSESVPYPRSFTTEQEGLRQLFRGLS